MYAKYCTYCKGRVEIMPAITAPAICRDCGLKHKVIRTTEEITLEATEDEAKLTENQLARLKQAREVRKFQTDYYEVVEKNTHYSIQYETKDVPSFGKAFGWLVISGLPIALAIVGKLELAGVFALILVSLAMLFAAVSTYFKALEISEAKERLEAAEAVLRKFQDVRSTPRQLGP